MIDFPASPTTGQIFSAAGASWRYDGTKWVAYGSGSGNAGRNLIHNPMFNIAQRGNGPWTADGSFTMDRWSLSVTSDTASITRQNLGDPDATAIGDEAARFQLVNTFTGNVATGAFNQITQRVENVYRFSGKTVTVSFWAKANAALKLGINLTQVFGTGGSPSAPVRILATGNSVTLSTSWVRYSSTIVVPSVSGKTIGTNSNDCTQLEFWFSSGATSNAAAGNIGVQSGTIQLWGVQLEIGSVATPLEKPDPADDLARCQRFYQIYTQMLIFGYAPSANSSYGDYIFAVPMRSAPSTIFSSVAYSNASGLAVNGMAASHMRLAFTITATGNGYATADVALSADL